MILWFSGYSGTIPNTIRCPVNDSGGSEKYRDSYYSFQNYFKADNVTKDVNYANAQYSYGYAAMKLSKYGDAAQSFRKYLQMSCDIR